MAMINPGTVKSFLMEGYPVAINAVYDHVPFENSIDKYTVDVGKKGSKISIYDPDEEKASAIDESR